VVAPAAGSVVLVRFPFSDLSSTKLRPAIIMASAGKDDFVLCQVTSNPLVVEVVGKLTSEAFGRVVEKTVAIFRDALGAAHPRYRGP
jgi:mRNA interferase MazF